MRAARTIFAFACIGAVGGAASATMVEPCFAIVLAPTTLVLCAVLGAIIGRLRHGWALTIPLVPLAGAVNGAVAASIALHDAAGPGAHLGLMCSVPFAFVLPPTAYLASRTSARAGSLARSLERWHLAAATTLACGLLTSVAIAPWRFAFGGARESRHVLTFGLSLLVLGAAFVSLVAVLARRAAAREARRTIPLLRACEPGTGPVAKRDADYLDLGLGTTQHVYLDPTTMLRAMPTARVMFEGDAQPVVQLAGKAMTLALVTFAFALALSGLVFYG